MNRSNLRRDRSLLSHFNRFFPLNQSCWLVTDNVVRYSMFLVLWSQFNRMNILSERTVVKDTSLRLIFFNSQNSVSFLSDSVMDNAWSQWIRSWLLMINLHPTRTQNIFFAQIFMLNIFHWSFSIFGISINGYNSLVLWDNLNHS